MEITDPLTWSSAEGTTAATKPMMLESNYREITGLLKEMALGMRGKGEGSVLMKQTQEQFLFYTNNKMKGGMKS